MVRDMLTNILLKQQLGHTLEKTEFNFGAGTKYIGKVRDNYILDDKIIMVTTDRISAFDVVLTTLPFKGQVLNQMSQFWFEKTNHIVPNHVIDVPDPNVTVAGKCKPIMVEFVVRGYITGVTTTSIWHNYERGAREFCGHKLPDRLKKDQKLPEPILTPSTKAEKGQHDESVSRADVIKRGLMSADEFDKVAEISLRLFELGQKIAALQGIILVDTKYEFGYDENGRITLIDEVHTPDSSRFWFANTYDELFRQGKEQNKIDKEYVRKWLADRGFMGDGPVPEIPDDVRVEAARRYIEAYELVTGRKFSAAAGNPVERIRQNLIRKGYLKG
ncbi:MAG TPA: phosphoribosylaminoimidazolesuccinocarboxamide synthase [Candidatus Nanoarchaeia archaeon]|nr:phosphoribosylaminoimidazolesuccinocarboxamide synthase [Candidatus Nanoarchaeia archaeon]